MGKCRKSTWRNWFDPRQLPGSKYIKENDNSQREVDGPDKKKPKNFFLGFLVPSVARGRLEDRKSTRLNSSHVKISYAVFCLKKKNNHEARDGPRRQRTQPRRHT